MCANPLIFYVDEETHYLFQKRLQHEVLMHPENFGRELQQKLRKRLCEDVEGTVPETTGIIVAVLRFYDEQDVKRGLIEYETGYASFIVNYEAIIYRPFKNQVLDAKVRYHAILAWPSIFDDTSTLSCR